MTWAMIGASAVAVVGSIASQQMSKGKAGPVQPGAQIAPDQKSAPLQSTASKFQQGTPLPPPPQQVQQIPPAAAQAAVMPTINQNDPLGDFLKKRQFTGYE